jgi:hypothetical protein
VEAFRFQAAQMGDHGFVDGRILEPQIHAP